MPNSENFITGCGPDFGWEIEEGLEALGKTGYSVHVQDGDNVRLITFTLGESEQTLEFKENEWQKAGVVSKAIIERLNI